MKLEIIKRNITKLLNFIKQKIKKFRLNKYQKEFQLLYMIDISFEEFEISFDIQISLFSSERNFSKNLSIKDFKKFNLYFKHLIYRRLYNEWKKIKGYDYHY